MAKYDCFWGLFCDMRSADGNMSEMVVDVPAAIQYPVACRVRQLASKSKMRSNKVILTSASGRTRRASFATTGALMPSLKLATRRADFGIGTPKF